MVIEFLGVSGVGKTTIAKQYREKLEFEGKKVIWDTYDLYNKHTWFIRNVYKLIHIIFFSTRNYDWIKKYKHYLDNEIEDKSDRIIPFFNGIFLKTMLHKAHNDQSIHLFDEGSLQCLLAIKLRSKKTVDVNDISIIESLYYLPTEIIVVNANSKIISDRILRRREYVRIMDYDNLERKIIEMQDVQEKIINIVENKVQIIRVKNE